jgi:hypothetical protein
VNFIEDLWHKEWSDIGWLMACLLLAQYFLRWQGIILYLPDELFLQAEFFGHSFLFFDFRAWFHFSILSSVTENKNGVHPIGAGQEPATLGRTPLRPWCHPV